MICGNHTGTTISILYSSFLSANIHDPDLMVNGNCNSSQRSWVKIALLCRFKNTALGFHVESDYWKNKSKKDCISYLNLSSCIRTMVLTPLLTSVLLALVVAAEPIVVKRSPVSLPLTRRININADTQNLVQHDQARVKALKTNSEAKAAGIPRQVSSPAINEAVQYIASIGVGSPATQCKWLQQLLTNLKFTNIFFIFIDDLVVDTSKWAGLGALYTQLKGFHSPIVWIESSEYVITKTSHNTGQSVVSGLGTCRPWFVLNYWISLSQVAPASALLSSPIRLELIECRKHRYWVHRWS